MVVLAEALRPCPSVLVQQVLGLEMVLVNNDRCVVVTVDRVALERPHWCHGLMVRMVEPIVERRRPALVDPSVFFVNVSAGNLDLQVLVVLVLELLTSAQVDVVMAVVVAMIIVMIIMVFVVVVIVVVVTIVMVVVVLIVVVVVVVVIVVVVIVVAVIVAVVVVIIMMAVVVVVMVVGVCLLW